MAHFAELDHNNVVTRVIVIHNDVLKDENGVEQEALGEAFCKLLYGPETRWKQTSYSASFRKNFAGEGYSYYRQLDSFIPPKPYESWSLNISTANWDSPIPYPNDGKLYKWNEEIMNWREIL